MTIKTAEEGTIAEHILVHQRVTAKVKCKEIYFKYYNSSSSEKSSEKSGRRRDSKERSRYAIKQYLNYY